MTDTTLRSRLAAPPILVAPGVYDALTAHLAERAGFSAVYVSGAGIAYTRLGRPDIGLVAMSEVADTVALIRDRVGSHLIVDADTGYGNALNVARTVRLFERAGANAIQIEDQDFPKRCGHLDNKTLIPAQEMVGKIKAALDARHSRETLVIARTDAIAVEGFEPAIARAVAYRDAGADVLFVEAPKTRDELRRIAPALKGVPLMANMVEGGRTPALKAADLEALGFALVIFPGGIVRAVGPDVTLFKPGDRVWYAGSIARPGTNSELHLVDERIVGHAPTSLEFAEAAALPLTAITAWELLFDRLGVAPGEAVGHSIFHIYPPDHIILKNFARALAGERFSSEVRAQGHVWETRYAPLEEGGQITGVIGVASDVTDRKRAEAERDWLLTVEKAARAAAEEALRQTLTISRGSFAIFLQRPMSLWIVAITLAIIAAAPLMRRFQPKAA